jgi:hypothetical protein
VVPCTTYQEEADDDDQYAAMSEAFKTAKLYTEIPLYERFISKATRDTADEGSFAGKGKSFPILHPSDVGAAVHAMGRAGDSNYGPAQLKANIVRIAKGKGFTSELPKAWRGGDSTTESVKVLPGKNTGGLVLIESANTLETIVLREAKADYEIKLIAPGKGSSAFYPAEVLKRDGPKVFGVGTHVYLNHPTPAEEAARPEGDVKNLAGVLTTAAAYHESHAKGPGLYARMKVFADHGQMVEEKAAHVGMSIRASGMAEAGKSKDGLPVLKELTSAESVDIVTRAGAGGMVLTEAAKPGIQQEVSDMDADKLQALSESLAAATAKLDLREARANAKDIAVKALEGLKLPAEAKEDIVARVLESVPMKDGALDEAKFSEGLKTETARTAKLLASVSGNGRVTGMGTSVIEAAPGTPPKPEEINARSVAVFKRLGLSEAAAKRAVAGRVA